MTTVDSDQVLVLEHPHEEIHLEMLLHVAVNFSLKMILKTVAVVGQMMDFHREVYVLLVVVEDL